MSRADGSGCFLKPELEAEGGGENGFKNVPGFEMSFRCGARRESRGQLRCRLKGNVAGCVQANYTAARHLAGSGLARAIPGFRAKA
jgi:hypothetical protein